METLSNIVYYVVPFVVLLGLLVFVHEFGHFIVARLLGVKVVAFSIGFGKVLWSRTDKKGTEWKLSAIPLGGYCQFLGDGDASSSTTDKALKKLTKAEKKQAFALQSTWKKIAIVVAGPLFNYLLAVILFAILFVSYGRAVIQPYVGEVMPDSAAAKVGIMAGDKITSINNNPTPDFWTLARETDLASQDPVLVKVERSGKVRLSSVEMEHNICGKTKKEMMIGLVSELPNSAGNTDSEVILPVIGSVLEGSPAEKAGLRQGDVIDSVDDVKVSSFNELKQYVEEHPAQEIEITYHRNIAFEAYLQDSVVEEVSGGTKRRMLGVVSSSDYTYTQKVGLAEAIPAGIKETYDITAMTLRGVWQIITGRRGGKDVGGIIRIAEMSGDASKKGGISGFIYFMALISVNLGLINLFPIPVLDGGNLVIYLIEMVIRRELKPNIKDWIFRFGLIILLALMVWATWNDIVHLISRWFK